MSERRLRVMLRLSVPTFLLFSTGGEVCFSARKHPPVVARPLWTRIALTLRVHQNLRRPKKLPKTRPMIPPRNRKTLQPTSR